MNWRDPFPSLNYKSNQNKSASVFTSSGCRVPKKKAEAEFYFQIITNQKNHELRK